MIILEGADAVGKTTTANALCRVMANRFGGEPANYYGHMSRPPEDFDHVTEYMRGVRLGVQDRYHLGSVVYGRLLGGGTFTTARRMVLIQRYLRWCGCLTIIFYADRQWLKSRLRSDASRVEMYSDDRILDANDAFRSMAGSHNRGEPWADASVDVTIAWPSQSTLESWVDQWWARWGQSS